MIHHLDVLRLLLGPLTVVAARLNRLAEGLPGEDTATILMQARDGTLATADGCICAPGYPPLHGDRLELVGEHGTIVMDLDRVYIVGREDEAETGALRTCGAGVLVMSAVATQSAGEVALGWPRRLAGSARGDRHASDTLVRVADPCAGRKRTEERRSVGPQPSADRCSDRCCFVHARRPGALGRRQFAVGNRIAQDVLDATGRVGLRRRLAGACFQNRPARHFRCVARPTRSHSLRRVRRGR